MSEIVSFGEWVQTRRNYLKYSRTVLAGQVGCSPITIKKIERDERRPSVQIAELLATHLQLPTAEHDAFVRKARGEFISRFGDPTEMSLAEAKAPASDEDAPKHNLPLQTTPFFGREKEVEELTTKLSNPACRLLTIMGAGGMGKTRLAITLGERFVDEYTDGIVYVSLAPVSSQVADGVNPVAAALADVLQASFQGSDPLENQVARFLRRKEMLLIFDNFEHLINYALFIGELITQAPDIKFLVTSRERLDLQEEWLYPLKGLQVQDGPADNGPSAVQLFEQRAKQLDPKFGLEGQLPAVLEICELVEGMPLAIELAATWVRQLSCGEIVAEIKSELDFLATGSRNVPERHRSVRALFDYSWQQMSVKERMVLQRLSVFRGGFEREAAKAVANASLSLLRGLVDKSLIAIDENGRYQIHELLRQFSAEKLGESVADETEAHSLHCQHYLTQLDAQAELFFGPDLILVTSIMKQEIGNIRAAIDFGIIHRHDLFTPDVGRSLFNFYAVVSWPIEAAAILNIIVQAIKPDCMIEMSEREPQSISQPCLNWAIFQIWYGHFLQRLMRLQEAEETMQQALAILPTIDDSQVQWTRAWGLLMLTALCRIKANPVRAFQYAQKSAELSSKVGHVWGQASALFHQATVARSMGDYAIAQDLLKDSQQLLIGLGNLATINDVQRDLNKLACYRGELDTAQVSYQAILARVKQTGYQMQITEILEQLGEVNRLQGNIEEARDNYQQSLTVAKEYNLLDRAAIALWGLGNTAIDSAEYSRAKHYFEESGFIHRSIGDIIGGIGWAYLGLGQLPEAKRAFQTTLRKVIDTNLLPQGLDALVGMAHLAAQTGQLSDALEWLTLVQHHPASRFEINKKAQRLWDELTAELPGTDVAEAQSSGRLLDLQETIEALLQSV